MDRQEAIKIVERNWPDGRSALQEALGVLVPELSRTGKDERIRKMLIERVRNAEELNEELRERIIAYLEKQKEQKPSPSIYWHAIKRVILFLVAHICGHQNTKNTTIALKVGLSQM